MTRTTSKTRAPLNSARLIGMVVTMTNSESRRHELYSGLIELIGSDRADTLMKYLPYIEGSEQATRTDFYGLTNRIDDVERSLNARLDQLEHSMTARFDKQEQLVASRLESMTARFDAMNQRIDRIVLTLAAGLVAIVATLLTQTFL